MPKNQFGRAAANVDHQAPLGRRTERIGHAHVDQAPFFFARNDFNRVADGQLGGRQEGGAVFGDAQGRGGHYPHRIEPVAGQDGVEIVQAGQCRLHCGARQIALGIKPGGKADRFAHAFEHADGVTFVLTDM